MLGDEMGLGKTVQALAVMVHFQASGIGRHFIVVAPASIVRNWERECTRHTTLVPFLAYGPEKTAEIGKWIEQGGVAITSYTTLRALDLAATLRDRAIQPTMVVFDEAHFIKNPSARRTQASRDLAAMARHACLMTGTPLENRLEEFRALLEVVDSKIARTSEGVVGGVVVEPSRFQMAIAPVYLRRKVREVLRELPEKLEHEEWVDLDAADRDAYRSALASGNYMAVRRSVTAHGVHTTAKLERLKGLVRMHTEAGRKCLVFSFFLAVLDAVERELDTFGRLTGQVSPDQRSRIVASFERASGPAVLLAQITAGGVGLNLQAASVVILMEPQFKPSTEQQAIARAHRMGQTERVYVHRLLAAESVDERMVELLRGKLDTFRRYADPSLLKEASRESTEARFAQAVIAVERARLGIEGRATINPGEL
ncbi:MAG: DEAD/DEAH box helicase [Deltaproteobacteria bacterium]